MKIKVTNFKTKNIIGLYDKKTIYIDRKLKLTEKIGTFFHEFGHYLIDVFKLGKNYNYVYDIICVLFDKRYKRKKKAFIWYSNYYLN